MQYLFFKIGNEYIAVAHIQRVIQHANGDVDIDYGRNDETLPLTEDKAAQFLSLLKQHCTVITKDEVTQ